MEALLVNVASFVSTCGCSPRDCVGAELRTLYAVGGFLYLGVPVSPWALMGLYATPLALGSSSFRVAEVPC